MHALDRTAARCFVDTNVWLYAFIESDDVQKRATAKAIVQSCAAVISTQVINETCVNLVKKASCRKRKFDAWLQPFTKNTPSPRLTRTLCSQHLNYAKSIACRSGIV